MSGTNDVAEANSLPLGWTQVSRCVDSDDCDNPATCGRRHLLRSSFLSTSKDDTGVVLEGQAVFCLCEIDPLWFQGYFVTAAGNTQKPLGLLAEQTDIDDCLACADGGYHEISMKLYQGGAETTTVFQNIAWTGADMMKLESDTLDFETERFLSGQDALPLVRQFFSGMVDKLRDENDDESASILDIIPDVAVVVGKMRLAVPNNNKSGFVNV